MNFEVPFLVKAGAIFDNDDGVDDNLELPVEIMTLGFNAFCHFDENEDKAFSHVKSLHARCLTLMKVDNDGSPDAYEWEEIGVDHEYRMDIYTNMNDHFWTVFAWDIFNRNQNLDDAAAMMLLLCDDYLKEINRPTPRLNRVIQLLSSIKDLEAAILCLTDGRPNVGPPSFMQKAIDSARKAGQVKSWHKKSLQEVINQTELGLSWKLIFNRLADMGNNVPHPQIKSIEYFEEKLKVTPTNEAHNPCMITYRTLTSYDKPVRGDISGET